MAVDTDVRAVGRNGAVTLDEAAAAARKLREFTRADLATELGIKPIAVGKFLMGLTERSIVEHAEDERGVFYRCLLEPLTSEVFLPPEPPEDPLEAEVDGFRDLPVAEEPESEEDYKLYGRVTAEEVRDWAHLLERFTVAQLAREMEVSYGTAKRYVMRLAAQGLIVDNGWKGERNEVIWEVRGEVPEGHLRRQRRPPVEQEVLAKWKPSHPQRGLPIPSGDLPNVSNDKDIRFYTAQAVAFGFKLEERAKHYRIVTPAGTVIGVPSTPSGGGVRRFRDELRRAGLPDLGEPNQTIEDSAPTPGRGVTVGETSRTHKRRMANSNVAGTRRPGRKNQGRHHKT